MLDTFLNIISFGLKPIYEKHLKYYQIIDEFRNKLPRQQNEARQLSKEEKEKNFPPSTLQHVNILDLSTHKISIHESDIDMFYNKLNTFDYRFMFFKGYYKGYTKNLFRFTPKAENKDFNLVMVQQVLRDEALNPIKPFDVLIHHLKWKIKLTSRLYVFFSKLTKKRKI